MDNSEYLTYLISSIQRLSEFEKTIILSQMLQRGIVSDDKQLDLSYSDAIDLSHIDVTEDKLNYAIMNSYDALKFYEKRDYRKNYKYSVYYRVKSMPNMSFFDQIIDKGYAEAFGINECNVFNNHLSTPVYYRENSVSYLKFLLKRDYYDINDGEETKHRYVVLVVFHSSLNIVEIRYDSCSVIGRNHSSFYIDNLDYIKHWIEDKMGFTLMNFDLLSTINNVTFINPKDEICVDGKNYQFVNGAQADLYVGHNQDDYTLPLISEIKKIVELYKEDLEKVPELKKALDEFIVEKETDSYSNWIMLSWKNEVRSKKISVKCTFNFKNQGFDLVMHYSNRNKDKERMDYVIQYFINN